MRRAAKRDATESAIVRALEQSGWTVVRQSDEDAPDLLCARNGVLVLLEVKTPGGSMQPGQVELHKRLDAAGVTVGVVETPEEALRAVTWLPRGLDWARSALVFVFTYRDYPVKGAKKPRRVSKPALRIPKHLTRKTT